MPNANTTPVTVASLRNTLNAYPSSHLVSINVVNGVGQLSIAPATAGTVVLTAPTPAPAVPAPRLAPIPTFRNGAAVHVNGRLYTGGARVEKTEGYGEGVKVFVRATGNGKRYSYNAADLRGGKVTLIG